MFLGDRIRQAREIRGLTQEELARKLGRSKAMLAQAEAGFTLPSLSFIESIALATAFPLSFFDSEPHSEFPLAEILLRARRDLKRREALSTVRYAEHIFAVFLNLASKAKPIPVHLPSLQDSPAEAAKRAREAFGVQGDGPLGSLIHHIERAGVCFLLLPHLEGREAFCVWARLNDREVPVIAASASRQDGDRYRLSVAHELGHLVLHKSFLRKANAEVEEEAFAFAAELLMPESAMRREIIAPFTLTSFAKLKPRWGVSIAALVRRAHELRIITTRQYHYLFRQMSIAGIRNREPENLDVALERPRLLRKLAELAYGDPIDFNRFSSDTSVSPQELRAIIADYRERSHSHAEPKAAGKVLSFPRT